MSFRQTIIASFAWLSLGFNPSDLEAQSFAPNIKEMALESRAWSGEPKELRDLEQDVTAIIQSDPYNFFAHYILSQVYLRLFTAEPEDMMLLKAASDLAQQAIELAPAEEYGYIALATVLDAMGHSAKATQLLKSIIARPEMCPFLRLFINSLISEIGFVFVIISSKFMLRFSKSFIYLGISLSGRDSPPCVPVIDFPK